jgi:5-(carboxyamino)imidazole ribonucleotide synthase
VSEAKQTRVGVLGAGQLALMLADAAKTLGVEVICAGQRGDCAEQVAPVVVVDLEDAEAVAAFAKKVNVVTIESENIDSDVLRGLNLYPNANAVGVAQDRLVEKRFFKQCGIEVAPFEAVDSLRDLELATETLGFPSILKTRRMGYDGKGQVRLQSVADVAGALAEVGDVPCILEGMVAFEAEVSLIAARGREGAVVFYPLIENVHREGILRRSTVPYSRATVELQELAESYMMKVLEALEYVGVLAIEFFVVGDGLVANEMAPRVHNSGHWTIEGAKTSQFENHLRAIAGMPLEGTESAPTVMLNCIGEMPTAEETERYPLHRHDYGKEGRVGRKVGHLTFAAGETAALDEWYRRLNPEAASSEI